MIPTAIVVGAGFLAGFFAGRLVWRRHEQSGKVSASGDARGSAPELTQTESRPDPAKLQRSTPEPQLDQFMLGAVDMIDEIELMKSGSNSEAARSLALVRGRLEDNIALAGGELIHENVWQPALQRAVKVEPVEPGQTDVRVLRTRATGLKLRGRLIRKQEVVISQP